MRTKNHTYGHYAYTHSDPDGRVFYVGKGQGRRAHVLICRHAVHQRRIDEVGRSNVKITIYPVKQEFQAFALERNLIEKFKAEGAPLCNQEGIVRRRPKVHIDLEPELAQKLKVLGMDWLRDKIKRAPSPFKEPT